MKTPIPEAWQRKIAADAELYECTGNGTWQTLTTDVYKEGATQWAEQCQKLVQALGSALDDMFFCWDNDCVPTKDEVDQTQAAIAEFEAFLKEGV